VYIDVGIYMYIHSYIHRTHGYIYHYPYTLIYLAIYTIYHRTHTHRSVTVAEELARELQVEFPKVGVHIEHMELPVPDDKDACLLSDVDKGRVARLEVCLCM